MNSYRIGQRLEQDARAYLEDHGLRHLAANVRCPGGELDLVMMDGDILAFVEVRGRRGDLFGSAAESVTRDKQSRLIRAAEFFLAKRPKLTHHGCRFDVIAVDLSAEPTRLEWIKDAFDAG